MSLEAALLSFVLGGMVAIAVGLRSVRRDQRRIFALLTQRPTKEQRRARDPW